MTSIEWTDETWNPFKGCSRVSPGCDNCYAMLMAHRFPWGDGLTRIRKKDESVDWSGTVRFYKSELGKPLGWRKARRVFVCSGSDIFHEKNSFEQIAAVFGVMAACPQHTFQVLTKRPRRAAEFFAWLKESGGAQYATLHWACIVYAGRMGVDMEKLEEGSLRSDGLERFWPLPNVWMGVSAEDQQRWDERVPVLMELPAEIHFVSAEPLLGPIDFTAPRGRERVNWVIVGGESGRGARPLELAWVESLVAQCKLDEIACFVKQLGHAPQVNGNAWGPEPLTGKGGDPEQWPPHLRVRQWPESTMVESTHGSQTQAQ